MKLVSVNVAEARPIKPEDPESELTGIYKLPVAELTRVTSLGLQGDTVCEIEHHGGLDQAVYVYGDIDYVWWSKELGKSLEPGLFGENLTIAGYSSVDARVGDRLHIGEMVLEVTSPRIPCGTFALRMGDKDFAKRFRLAERPGVYCRVIREGEIVAGDDVRLERSEADTVSCLEVFRDFYKPELTEAAIQRFLDAPIAIRERIHKEKQLSKLRGA